MYKSLSWVNVLLESLEKIRKDRIEFKDSLSSGEDFAIENLIGKFEFFSATVETYLKSTYEDPHDKLHELRKIQYVPDFKVNDVDFNKHFMGVEQEYRSFFRILKYEKDYKGENRILTLPESQSTQNNETSKDKIFIVHGHDDALKTEVARFIEKQRIEAIILHEQTDTGETIIEKIEKHSDVGFAIILYTPCDLGRSSLKSEESNKHRARQNVVFEHGYFMAKLGRSNVLALKKEDVEIPGDLSGTIHTEYDSPGAWKLKLAKTLANAGYEIDSLRI